MASRYFTREEANRLLPRLEALMGELVHRRQELLQKEQLLETLRARLAGNGHSPDREGIGRLRQEVEELIQQLRQGIADVEALGCLVKDLEMGLVDFPTLRGGREVYLCWRLGEEEVAFWHSVEEGFAGRKPLKGDLL